MHEKNKKVRQLSNKKDRDKLRYAKGHYYKNQYMRSANESLYGTDDIYSQKKLRHKIKQNYQYIFNLDTRQYLEKISSDKNLVNYVNRLITLDSMTNTNDNFSFEFTDTIDEYTQVTFIFSLAEYTVRKKVNVFDDSNILLVCNNRYYLNICDVYFKFYCIVHFNIKKLDILNQNGILINFICSQLFLEGNSNDFNNKEIQGISLECFKGIENICNIMSQNEQFKDLIIKDFDIINFICNGENECCCLNCDLYVSDNVYRSKFNYYRSFKNKIIMSDKEPFYRNEYI